MSFICQDLKRAPRPPPADIDEGGDGSSFELPFNLNPGRFGAYGDEENCYAPRIRPKDETKVHIIPTRWRDVDELIVDKMIASSSED